jgi:amidase
VTDLLLSVDQLHSGYGRIPVLHGVTFEVQAGEVVGMLGHNGMGKTTLLKTLMGYIPATRGAVSYDGRDITRLAAHDRSNLGISYVPQGRGMFAGLTARENLEFAWNGANGLDVDAAIDGILQDLPRLVSLLDRPAGALSGGEQQILAIARGLISDPDLLLLDEPTEGIQPSIIEEIAAMLSRLQQDRGLAIVVVEQNLDFLMALSDRLLLLEKGAITGNLRGDQMRDAALIEEFAGFGGAQTHTTTNNTGATGASVPAASAEKPAAVFTPQAASHLTEAPSLTPRPVLNEAVLNEAAPAAPVTNTAAAASEQGTYMTIRRPTMDQMRSLVTGLHMDMADDELTAYMELMEGTFQAYDRVDAMPDNLPPVRYPRTPGQRPANNPLNAWYYQCEVRGAATGPLSGKRVVLKDNVCLAGVPMMNGASTLEGYTPDVDATIVTRMLDAGATIVGKAHCEYFCLSGGSHTNATGPVHNPYRMGYSAGGSSSGSGALVGAGEVPMAIGGDQGGSIRIPASFCGCYGMKPTHGLVPYTGVMPIEPTIDHTGPITANVADNALLLEVIAGEDGLDPRQYAPVTDTYTSTMMQGVSSLRIGVVQEGFGLANSEADVDRCVQQAAEKYKAMGATVEPVSIPMHLDGPAIWTPIALEGLTDTMMHGNGFGTGWKGLYVSSLHAHHSNWRSRANELSGSLKVSMFAGEYMLKHYRGQYYAKAQNLSRVLKAAYDRALQQYDLLLMPTLPVKATPLPPPDAPLALIVQRAFEMVTNTAPFDATGHPAMSIPCALSEGLPVGMMLIGKHWQESTIYRAAYAFEQSVDWQSA